MSVRRPQPRWHCPWAASRQMSVDAGFPDVSLDAGQIDSGDADGYRAGGPAKEMESR